MNESLNKRYFLKLLSNGFGLIAASVTTLLVPRVLGPHTYGSFSFLSSFFQNVVSFLDSGTSTCYFSKISQRPQEKALIRFYGGYLLFCSLILFFSTAFVWFAGWEQWIWPDQDFYFVWMGLGWGIFTWLANFMQKTVDAYGLTVQGEKKHIQQRCLGLVLISLFCWKDWLDLFLFFFYHYFLLAFIAFAWYRLLNRDGTNLFRIAQLKIDKIWSYCREFYSYSSPLIILSLGSMATNVLDRWLLQKFAGSAEQGFFGLSYQIASICFLFSGAMAPLLLREFSQAFSKNDLECMRRLFLRYIPALFFVGALLAGFLAVQAEKVSFLVGGDQYLAASRTISIMAFFPIHMTYGQMCTSVLMAVGQTRLYRNIGFVTLTAGMFLSLWFIAPEGWGGLEMKASGIALKMVIAQVVTVNLILWFNAKLIDLPFWKLVRHQIMTVGALFILAWSIANIFDHLVENILFAFLGSGVLYVAAGVILIFAWPSFVWSSRTEIRRLGRRVLSLISAG